MAKIKSYDDLLSSVRYCYFAFVMANIAMFVLLVLYGDNFFNGEPIGLDKIPAMICGDIEILFISVFPVPFGLFLFLMSKKSANFKKTNEKLLNSCYLVYLFEYGIFAFLSILSLLFLVITNGNMVFLFCYVLFLALLLLKFPTKEKVMRAVEAAVEKNNQLPDDPKASESTSDDNEATSK